MKNLFAGLALAVALLAPARAQSGAHPIAFADLTLPQAIDGSLRNSPEMLAANAVVAQNEAALRAARAVLGPSLVSNYNLAPQANPVTPTTISQRSTSVGLQTTLGDLAAYAPAVASAGATLQGSRASLEGAQRTERIKVIGLYYEALKALVVERARAQAQALAQQQRDAAAIRVNAGDAPRLDLVRANVTYARAVAGAALAGAASANAAQALRVETGSSAALTATVDGEPPPARELSPEDAVRMAERSSPELRAAAAGLRSAQAAADVAARGILPAVTLGAGYSRGVDSGVEVSGPTINVALTFPLSGGALAGAAQKRAVASELAARQSALARTLLLDVSAAARNLEAAHRATVATTEARVQAEAELRATQLGYRSGASSSLEASAAQDTFSQAVVDELSSLYDELKARETLNVEVGA